MRVLVAGDPAAARALVDAGHEVVYAGADQSPDSIAAAAVQEAVDAIVGDPAVSAALAARGAGDIVVGSASAIAARPRARGR